MTRVNIDLVQIATSTSSYSEVLASATATLIGSTIVIGIATLAVISLWSVLRDRDRSTPFEDTVLEEENAGSQSSRLSFLDRETEEERAIDPRTLLPLSTEERDPKRLLKIAHSLKHRYGEKPIHLFSVHDPPVNSNTDQHIADKECLLTELAEYDEVSDTDVRSETSVSDEIAPEIVRQAQETRADLILMERELKDQPEKSIFDSTIDPVLKQTAASLYILQVKSEIHSVSHIHVVIPWAMDHHEGFYEAIYNVKQLAGAFGATITVYVFIENTETYRTLFDLVEIDVLADFESVSSWDELYEKLETQAQLDDLIVMFSVREGEVGWDEKLHDLPANLESLPSQSCAVFFLRRDESDYGERFLRTE